MYQCEEGLCLRVCLQESGRDCTSSRDLILSFQEYQKNGVHFSLGLFTRFIVAIMTVLRTGAPDWLTGARLRRGWGFKAIEKGEGWRAQDIKLIRTWRRPQTLSNIGQSLSFAWRRLETPNCLLHIYSLRVKNNIC